MTTAYTIDPWKFAQEWQDGWNSHDLDRIMAHYHEEVVFRSARAKALKHQPELKFQVQDVLLGHEVLVIIYSNQNKNLATETFYFNAEGRVFRAAACHQATRL